MKSFFVLALSGFCSLPTLLQVHGIHHRSRHLILASTNKSWGQHYPTKKFHPNVGDVLRAKKFLHGSAAIAKAKPTPKTFMHDFLTNLQSSSLQVPNK